MRTFPAEIEAMIDSGRMRIANLASVFFTDATLRITDFDVDVTLSGTTYTSSGALLGIPSLTEKDGEPITTGSLTLSNIGGIFNTTIRGTNQMFRPVNIYQVAVDLDGSALGVLLTRKLFITAIDQANSETEDAYKIGLSNHLYDFQSVNTRTTSETSQKKYAADRGIVDTSFRHTNVLKSNVPWGKK